jgi:hypothetical protein
MAYKYVLTRLFIYTSFLTYMLRLSNYVRYEWMEQSLSKLISDYKDATTLGFWFITKTYVDCTIMVVLFKVNNGKIIRL